MEKHTTTKIAVVNTQRRGGGRAEWARIKGRVAIVRLPSEEYEFICPTRQKGSQRERRAERKEETQRGEKRERKKSRKGSKDPCARIGAVPKRDPHSTRIAAVSYFSCLLHTLHTRHTLHK